MGINNFRQLTHSAWELTIGINNFSPRASRDKKHGSAQIRARPICRPGLTRPQLNRVERQIWPALRRLPDIRQVENGRFRPGEVFGHAAERQKQSASKKKG